MMRLNSRLISRSHKSSPFNQAFSITSSRLPNATRTRFSTCSSSKSTSTSSFNSFFYLTATAFTFSTLLILNDRFTSNGTLRLDAPPPSTFRLDPSTSTPLALSIPSPASSPTSSSFQLVGLGVRTVSFLSVRVYVSALYVDENALKKLHSLPAWKAYNKDRLLSLKSGQSEVGKSGEELISEMVKAGIPCVVRIVPVRSTDFSHLRDGFTRSIQSRIKSARKSNLLDETIDQSLNSSVQELKSIFPKASLPKGETLDVVFYPSKNGLGATALALEQDGKVLGRVEALKEAQGWSVGRELLLAYFADKNEISKPFKQSVAEGFDEILNGKSSP